jgi:hypothetical protein
MLQYWDYEMNSELCATYYTQYLYANNKKNKVGRKVRPKQTSGGLLEAFEMSAPARGWLT